MMGRRNTEVEPYNTDGVLPQGIYRLDEDQFESHFVDNLQPSATRASLNKTFKDWRSDSISSRVDCAIQWVNGSFVQNIHDPNDIDVVTFIEYDKLNELPVVAQTFIERWMSKGRAQDKYGVDSYFHAYCNPDHSYYSVWSEKRETYKKLFSYTKHNDLPKGFIEMILGELSEEQMKVFEDQS